MIGLGYTVPAIISVVVVCVLEWAVLRTGLFRKPSYWISMVIVFAFQILIDGWLTKLSAPIVVYNEKHTLVPRSGTVYSFWLDGDPTFKVVVLPK